MADLMKVEDALDHILQSFAPLPAELLAIQNALGRSLAEDMIAGENLPPFANSSMDGYALRAADSTGASRDTPQPLRVTMDIPAGTAPTQRLNAGEAARIMTGAPMPEGADAVIPVEDTDSNWRAGDAPALDSQVQIYRSVGPGDYVRSAGESVHTGQTVLHAGTLLRPQDIGILASLGFAEVPVHRQPRVVIVSTGDELVDVSETPGPGQIRDSNSYTLAALVSTYGGIPIRLPVAGDTLDAVRGLFADALAQQPDIIMSSAGVSVGTFDIIRRVLAELGEVGFWRVNIRPGKPLAFGQVQSVPFFGLPGNPVSAMVTFDVFVRPALLRLQSRSDDSQTIMAVTGEDMKSDGRRSYLRVRLEDKDGQTTAFTTGTQSSGALMSMVLADGLLIIPEGVTAVAAGTHLPVRLLRR